MDPGTGLAIFGSAKEKNPKKEVKK